MSRPDEGLEETNAEARRIWNTNAAWWDDRKGDGSPFEEVLLVPVTERLIEL